MNSLHNEVFRVEADSVLSRKMSALLIGFLGWALDFAVSLLLILVMILSLIWGITSISPSASAYVSLQAAGLEARDTVLVQTQPVSIDCANCEVLAQRGAR